MTIKLNIKQFNPRFSPNEFLTNKRLVYILDIAGLLFHKKWIFD